MEEMRVYIEVNQNGRETTGVWFTLPIDGDDFEDRTGVDVDSEDYRIIEKELPFPADVRENTSVDTLNDLFRMYEALPLPFQQEVAELLDYFPGLEELYQHCNDIVYYENCSSMTDIVRYLLAENPDFQSLTEECREFFDFEAYANDLSQSATFLITDHGIFELP